MTHDPDLMQAIEDLFFVVPRIRRLEEMAVRAQIDPQMFKELGRVRAERADLIGQVRLRAERLNLPWRSLLLIVDTAFDIKRPGHKKIDPNHLARAVRLAAESARRGRIEAEAELQLAIYAEKLAVAKNEAAEGADAYLRAA